MEQSECVSFDDDVEEEALEDDVQMADAELMENGRFWEEEADSLTGSASGIGGGRGDGVGGCEQTGNSGGGGDMRDTAMWEPKRKRRRNKKRRRSSSTANIADINRFVINTCQRLKEKKLYLVWNAIGCLGFSAMMDLVKEVDAIQHCGGQETTIGMHYRTGGGVLWNILKNRDPKAYKEIMAKGKEFENQFRQPQKKKSSNNNAVTSRASNLPHVASEHAMSDSSDKLSFSQNVETSEPYKRRSSVLDRIRLPVTYDDLLEEGRDDDSPAVHDDLLEEGDKLPAIHDGLLEEGGDLPVVHDDLLEEGEIYEP